MKAKKIFVSPTSWRRNGTLRRSYFCFWLSHVLKWDGKLKPHSCSREKILIESIRPRERSRVSHSDDRFRSLPPPLCRSLRAPHHSSAEGRTRSCYTVKLQSRPFEARRTIKRSRNKPHQTTQISFGLRNCCGPRRQSKRVGRDVKTYLAVCDRERSKKRAKAKPETEKEEREEVKKDSLACVTWQ